MNVTDVGHLVSDADDGEDKMTLGAKREGKTVWELAEFYWTAFKKDMKRLNLIEPDIWCKATDHIQKQIDQVRDIVRPKLRHSRQDTGPNCATTDKHLPHPFRSELCPDASQRRRNAALGTEIRVFCFEVMIPLGRHAPEVTTLVTVKTPKGRQSDSKLITLA